MSNTLRLLSNIISILAITTLLSVSPIKAEEIIKEGVENVTTELHITPNHYNNLIFSTIDTSKRPGHSDDAASLIKEVPGVSGVRMSGHGIDPVIRGQSQSRLDILLEGAFLSGGCPNRMDPPTSYSTPQAFNTIKVIKGLQTLRYSGSATGGTVLFEKQPPLVDNEHPLSSSLQVGLSGNDDKKNISGDISAGNIKRSLRAYASHSQAHNYKDGNGSEVRSAYEIQGQGLQFHAVPSDSLVIDLDLARSASNDVLYAGAEMDSPESDSLSGNIRVVVPAGVSTPMLKLEGYANSVDHQMDNYSLRAVGPMKKPMRAPSSVNTYGGRAWLEQTYGRDTLLVGIDATNRSYDARRYMGETTDTVNTLQSALIPDTYLNQMSIFTENIHKFSEAFTARAAVRIDENWATAREANLDPMGMAHSANDLYRLYYGDVDINSSDTNVNGLLRLDYRLPSDVGLYVSLARGMRSADLLERFIAGNGAMDSMRWVGNPTLEPEEHRQIEVGANWDGENQHLGASLFLDVVEGFILRDRARAQTGIMQADGATIYRNVDAELFGGEVEGIWNIRQDVDFFATLSYTHGSNTSDNRPLAQIPPILSRLGIKYQGEKLQLMPIIRLAAKQTRVDDDPTFGSGLDFGKTAGYAVVDFRSEYLLTETITLSFGVDNIFDQLYTEHLNKFNAFDAVQERVNEPGRSLWIELAAKF
jgi:iron complex outermembrane receptor protein